MEPSEDNPFLDRLASARLTARELDVARFYEDNLPGAALLNLEEICRAVGVSSATVGRFARKLGYSDFRAMSRILRAGVREELSLPVERLRRMHDDAAPSPQSVLE
ncbi:MAG: MurR/RpiR family transcriptional regulator, partial [Schaalia sp.]